TDSLDRDGRPGGVSRTVIGSVASSTRDTIFVSVDGRPATAIPSSHIFALYESEGFHRHVGRGALIGFGVGLALGGPSGYASPIRFCDGVCDQTTNEDRVISAAIAGGVFGMVGAGLGALFGSGSHEHWREMPATRLRASVVPSRGGSTVRLSLR